MEEELKSLWTYLVHQCGDNEEALRHWTDYKWYLLQQSQQQEGY